MENIDRCKDHVWKESQVFTAGLKENLLSSSVLLCQVCLCAIITLKARIVKFRGENVPSTIWKHIKDMYSVDGCFHRHWDQYSRHTQGAQCILSEGQRRHIDSTSMSSQTQTLVIDRRRCAAMTQRPRLETVIQYLWRNDTFWTKYGTRSPSHWTIINRSKPSMARCTGASWPVFILYFCCSSVSEHQFSCLEEQRRSESGWEFKGFSFQNGQTSSELAECVTLCWQRIADKCDKKWAKQNIIWLICN